MSHEALGTARHWGHRGAWAIRHTGQASGIRHARGEVAESGSETLGGCFGRFARLVPFEFRCREHFVVNGRLNLPFVLAFGKCAVNFNNLDCGEYGTHMGGHLQGKTATGHARNSHVQQCTLHQRQRCPLHRAPVEHSTSTPLCCARASGERIIWCRGDRGHRRFRFLFHCRKRSVAGWKRMTLCRSDCGHQRFHFPLHLQAVCTI